MFANEKHMEVLSSINTTSWSQQAFLCCFNCTTTERHWSHGSANSTELPLTKAFLPLQSFSQICGASEKLTLKQSTFRRQQSAESFLVLTVLQSKAARETWDTQHSQGSEIRAWDQHRDLKSEDGTSTELWNQRMGPAQGYERTSTGLWNQGWDQHRALKSVMGPAQSSYPGSEQPPEGAAAPGIF